MDNDDQLADFGGMREMRDDVIWNPTANGACQGAGEARTEPRRR